MAQAIGERLADEFALWVGAAPGQTQNERIAGARRVAIALFAYHWARAVGRRSVGTPRQRRVGADRLADVAREVASCVRLPRR